MKPKREHATNNAQTYMVTTSTLERRALFRNERWAKLLIDTLCLYRGSAYLLHEFVIMPDHIHILLTPLTSLEKAVQFIKGGFSYRAKKELGSNMEVWQKGFSDHRIRDANDYALHVSYIHQNPVKERFCARPEECPYSSARPGLELDPAPQGLKPREIEGPVTARLEGGPFQSEIAETSNELDAARLEAVPFQSSTEQSSTEQGSTDQSSRQISSRKIVATEIAPPITMSKSA